MTADLVAVDGSAPQTVGSLRRRLTGLLRDGGIDTPDLDARLIVGHALGLDLTGLVLGADRAVGHAEAEIALRCAAERLSGKPVGRIIGRRGFYGLEFQLSPDTLEPRPDTETLVDRALASLHEAGVGAPIIADIGCGTGAILISLLVRLPMAEGVAIDISEGALRTAAANASAHGVADRLASVCANFVDALAPGRFDLIVTNPPYIASEVIRDLAVEVKEHDPMLALDGGADGLRAYRAIVPAGYAALKTGGGLMLEIGFDQASSVSQLMLRAGFDRVSVTQDLAGQPRVVEGWRL